MTAFRDIQPCTLVDVDPRFGGAYYLHHRPDDGGSMNLWNFGVLQRDYTALYPSKLSYSYSPPWEPEISQNISCSRITGRRQGIHSLSDTEFAINACVLINGLSLKRHRIFFCDIVSICWYRITSLKYLHSRGKKKSTSWSSGWHSCFAFRRSQVEISGRRSAILTKVSVVFLSHSRKMTW
jgi:hypothetical protein